MTFLEGQIEVKKAYVLYWQTLILSGAYKDKPISRAGRYLTVPELLKEATNTMLAHVHQLNELTEQLPSARARATTDEDDPDLA